jgi:hypothetical protein
MLIDAKIFFDLPGDLPLQAVPEGSRARESLCVKKYKSMEPHVLSAIPYSRAFV